MKALWIVTKDGLTQQGFTCSKSTIEPLEQGVKNI